MGRQACSARRRTKIDDATRMRWDGGGEDSDGTVRQATVDHDLHLTAKSSGTYFGLAGTEAGKRSDRQTSDGEGRRSRYPDARTGALRNQFATGRNNYVGESINPAHLVCILRSNMRFTLPSSLSKAPNRRLCGSFFSLELTARRTKRPSSGRKWPKRWISVAPERMEVR